MVPPYVELEYRRYKDFSIDDLLFPYSEIF